MEIKYLEWNLNTRGNKNYTIPSFVPEYMIQKNVDIMVLLEFRCRDNWNYFKCILEKDYDLYLFPYISGNYNQVCIALRRSRKFQMEKIIVEDACDINIPEFLQILMKSRLTLSELGLKQKATVKKINIIFLKHILRV